LLPWAAAALTCSVALSGPFAGCRFPGAEQPRQRIPLAIELIDHELQGAIELPRMLSVPTPADFRPPALMSLPPKNNYVTHAAEELAEPSCQTAVPSG